MLLRNVLATLLAATAMWRNPAVWVAMMVLIIGLIARVRTGLAFMPGIGSSQLEAAFPFLAALGVYLVFLAVAVILVSMLTREDTQRQEPQWGAAGGTFIVTVLVGTAFIFFVASLVSRAGLGSPWLEMVGQGGDALLMPAYVLLFARLDGDRTTSIGDALRALHVIAATVIVIALGASLQGAMPKADGRMGLVPLLPSFALSAAVTITQLLIACSASRAMTAASPPESAFR